MNLNGLAVDAITVFVAVSPVASLYLSYTPEMKEELSDFYGNYTSEKETAEVIKKLYEDTGYIIDTHTAVAAGVYDKYKEATGDTAKKTVIASTASPFKFKEV